MSPRNCSHCIFSRHVLRQIAFWKASSYSCFRICCSASPWRKLTLTKEKAERTQLLEYSPEVRLHTKQSALPSRLCQLRGCSSVFPGSPHGVGQQLRPSVEVLHLLDTERDWNWLHCSACDGIWMCLLFLLHTVQVLYVETSHN